MTSLCASRRTFVGQHFCPRQRGQGLVEFALILPVLLLMFVTALDFGRVAAAQVGLANAAREGAFQAAVTPTDFDPTRPCPADASSNKVWCRITLESSGGAAITPTDVSVSCAPACSTTVGATSTVTVQVRGSFQVLTPLMAVFFGSQTLALSANATEHREWLPVSGTTVPTPTPTPAPTPTPTCKVVPSVIGLTPASANVSIMAVGLTPSGLGDVGSGPKNSVTSQSPAAGACVAVGSVVTYHYRP